jgi:hypothetical protein
MGYRGGYYKKDGTYVQGHYVNSGRGVKYSNKKEKEGCISMLLLFVMLAIGISCTDDSSDCESKNCSDFSTQSEAQSVYDTDRGCYENLDSDNDGIPCENLPN